MSSSASIDPPYPVYGGIYREEAIMLLRKFYVQENEKAPQPRQKGNRELKTEILPLDLDKVSRSSPVRAEISDDRALESE